MDWSGLSIFILVILTLDLARRFEERRVLARVEARGVAFFHEQMLREAQVVRNLLDAKPTDGAESGFCAVSRF